MGGWMWGKIVDLMSDHHCLVPDLPDHGKSRGEGPFDHRDSARLVAEVIRSRAHGGKAHVVGISLGAQVLLQLLADFPERVDRAVVNSPEVRGVPGSRWLLAPALFDPLVKLTIPLARTRAFARLQARSYHLPEDLFEAYFEDTRQTSGEALARILRQNLTFELPAKLKAASAPVLVIAGSKEYGLMRESARDVAAVLPNARGYLVKGVGHTFSFEKPELYAGLIQGWIADRPLPEGDLVELSKT